jgi:arylsulfatase A-like enzyme
LSPFFLGPYGNEWVHTPTFDRLAARGVVFDQHFATDLDRSQDPASLIDPLAKDLQAVGVAIAIVSNDHAPRERHSLLSLRTKVYAALKSLPANGPACAFVVVDSLLPTWEPPKKFLNFYFGQSGRQEENAEPLLPWKGELPPAIDGGDDHTLERIHDTFAAVISAVDRGLAKLLAGCRQRGFGANALTVITSDLSYPLGEQGPVGWHAPGIWESIAHLPMIVRLPDNEFAGMRVPALTQPDDLVATMQSYFSGQRSTGMWPLIRSEAKLIRDHLTIRRGADVAVRTADRLCLAPHDSEPQLFVKPDDRWEMVDVASKREDECELLVKLAKS